NPLPGHLLNVLLFALSGVVLYLLLLRLMPKNNEWVPLIASCLFIVHPVHTEVVDNIKSLDEILSTLFLLLTLFTLFSANNKKALYSYICFALALLSKESALTGIAIIPLALYFFSEKKIKSILIKTLPYLGILIIYLLVREHYSGGFGKGFEASNPMDSPYILLSIPDKFATITYVCGRYLMLLFWPHPLSWDYSYHQIPDMSWGDIGPLVSLLIYAGLLVIALKSFRSKSAFGFGILFYLASFSIVSNVLINIGTTMGERFIYMPSVGFCISIAALLSHLLKYPTRGEIKYAVKYLFPLAVLAVPASLKTINRNRAWKDNFTLYETHVMTVPNSARSRLFYGIELLGKHRETKDKRYIDMAIHQMDTATVINPTFYHAFYNLGLAYQEKEDHENAIRNFREVLKLAPLHINTHYMLGVSLAKGKGQLDEGIAYMEKGVAMGYKDESGYSNLGIAYGMKGDFGKAIDIFKKGLSQHPNNAKLYLNLAVTYQNMGRPEEAKTNFSKAFELDPGLKGGQ
ncbi:MAG: tetratricopeptide repeat protein, partial [Flavobacteriales bacterium]